jgi:paraquat-inducible protein B
MSDREPDFEERGRVAEAVVETRGRPSIVWLIPLVAALVGGFVAWRAFSERGPEITISFKSAEGLEAGKTQIKYKDVEVGIVEEVSLVPDLSGVVCRARMVKGAERYLTDQTRFWVVRPRIAGGQVTGLETLLSGSYIGVDPVLEGRRARSFQGLEQPPVVTARDPGRYYTLRSGASGTLDVGSPVYFRRVEVGEVVSSELDPADDLVTTRIFVRAPFDQHVHDRTHFWNASGIDVSIGADGVKIDTESLVSVLIGGIAFDTKEGEATEVAAADTVFTLYQSREAAEERRSTRTAPYLVYFDESVRGLSIGAPVEFRGIEIGKVTDFRLEFDRERDRFRIPVRIEIDPQRFTKIDLDDKAVRREHFDHLVASGLRAQLKSGNLLTGQLLVSLDIFEDAKPAQIVWSGPIPVLPTMPTPLEEITASLTKVAERLGQLPIEQIGADLRAVLEEVNRTLKQADRTLVSANALIGPDSSLNSELPRALLEISDAARALGLAADQIEAQPDSLIFGKRGSD